MPIYEYECTNCQHSFELIQRISDISITQCPQCFNQTASRLVSAPHFQLKGQGWYATDFKNKPAEKPSTKKNNDLPTAKSAKDDSKKTNKSKTPVTEKKGNNS